MSGEFYEGKQPPTGPAEQFVAVTTEIAELHHELLRKKLGDAFLAAYETEDAADAELDDEEPMHIEPASDVLDDALIGYEQKVREDTFALIEDGSEPDPREAEMLASVKNFFVFMAERAKDEDDLTHSLAVGEINNLMVDAFGREGVYVPNSAYTWQLDPLKGVSPNSVDLITFDHQLGLALNLSAEGEDIYIEPCWRFPHILEAMTKRPLGRPSDYLTDADLVTFHVLAEEVIRRLRERVVPALKARLTA